MIEHFRTFDNLFFEMGIPARLLRDAVTEKDYTSFLSKYDGYNLYTSVYGFKEPENFDTAKVDKIFLEFDGPNKVFDEAVLSDFRKFLDYLNTETDIDPQIFFSGNSGFHVVIYFEEPNLFNKKDCIQAIVKNMAKLSNCRFLDLNANNGLSQMRRVPGSKHQKTGLFAIPLTQEEVFILGHEDILQLARHPRDKWFEVDNSKHVPYALKLLDDSFEQAKLARILKPRKKPTASNPDECQAYGSISQGVEEGVRDVALVGLIKMHQGSMDKEDLYDLVVDWHFNKNENAKHSDLSWLRYKVDYHYDKQGSHCWWFAKANRGCNSCPFKQ